jgi:hypothetical protein
MPTEEFDVTGTTEKIVVSHVPIYGPVSVWYKPKKSEEVVVVNVESVNVTTGEIRFVGCPATTLYVDYCYVSTTTCQRHGELRVIRWGTHNIVGCPLCLKQRGAFLFSETSYQKENNNGY